VADAFGNTLENTLTFQVSESFNLQIFGNYPNPFEDFTVISFLIVANNILDDFSLKIYTVAGRQIREIKNPQGSDEIWDPGYHEIEWDGRDEEGNLVANGVYFAQIKASLGGQSFEETMKIAKLR
jgi:flagellar hook assembly protein FlgD